MNIDQFQAIDVVSQKGLPCSGMQFSLSVMIQELREYHEEPIHFAFLIDMLIENANH